MRLLITAPRDPAATPPLAAPAGPAAPPPPRLLPQHALQLRFGYAAQLRFYQPTGAIEDQGVGQPSDLVAEPAAEFDLIEPANRQGIVDFEFF